MGWQVKYDLIIPHLTLMKMNMAATAFSETGISALLLTSREETQSWVGKSEFSVMKLMAFPCRVCFVPCLRVIDSSALGEDCGPYIRGDVRGINWFSVFPLFCSYNWENILLKCATVDANRDS